jgi:hypothetical protein
MCDSKQIKRNFGVCFNWCDRNIIHAIDGANARAMIRAYNEGLDNKDDEYPKVVL